MAGDVFTGVKVSRSSISSKVVRKQIRMAMQSLCILDRHVFSAGAQHYLVNAAKQAPAFL